MELDSRTKNLLRELGRAINRSVSDSDDIARCLARLKANGYDVFLMLDAVVGLNKRSTRRRRHGLSRQDRRFLKSLKIRFDGRAAEPDGEAQGQLTITPQDLKFLKALKINTDDF
ncbi:MAG: hypothetical protein ACE5HB_08330 [Terriglobia bacterium]